MKPTALIADDHRMFLDGLRALLSPHYEIVGEVLDGEALAAAAIELQPDIIVADLSMPKRSGLQVMRDLMGQGVASRFIILTMHAEPEYAAEAIEAGAAGYVLKNSATSDLLSAMSQALEGGVYITPQLALEVLAISREPRKSSALSERQQKILPLLANGLPAKDVGQRLKISPRTVEYHKYQILKKLRLKTTADLIQYAVKERLVERP